MKRLNERIKDWFIIKNFNTQQGQAIKNGYDMFLIKETEKAVNVRIETDFGTITTWLPKSALTTKEELKALEIKVNDIINHKTFGKGLVLEVLGKTLKVDFNKEVKTIINDIRFLN